MPEYAKRLVSLVNRAPCWAGGRHSLSVVRLGGAVCTGVRCFPGTRSACRTYRQPKYIGAEPVGDAVPIHARTAKSSSLHGPRVGSRPRAIGCGASITRQCRTMRQQAAPWSCASQCERGNVRHGENSPSYQSGQAKSGRNQSGVGVLGDESTIPARARSLVRPIPPGKVGPGILRAYLTHLSTPRSLRTTVMVTVTRAHHDAAVLGAHWQLHRDRDCTGS